MKSPVRKLPDTELEVMQAIWACDTPVSRAQIDEILKKRGDYNGRDFKRNNTTGI